MKFTKKILKNGLRVVTVPMKDNPAATVYVMVEAGTKYETKDINGLSHFLEHMVFKGTPKRPQASMISKELDSLGAEFNAFTGDEYTGYYAKVDKKHIDKALDIISDMYLNPLFPEDEIKKEKGVIIEEIRMYRDRPDVHVHYVLGELMFGDQPAGWSTLGPEENIRSFNRSHFLAYREKHYVASATTVVVAGGINEKEIVSKIEKKFAKMSTAKKHDKLAVKEFQTKPQVKVEFKNTDQTHLVISLRTFPLGDKRNPTMRLLSAVLGGGMSSRLFSKMRDELGICYYVRSSNNPRTDHGDLTISAGVDTTRVELAIKTILEEVERLRDELIPAPELKKAKDLISGRTMLQFETSDAVADYFAHQETLNKNITTPEERIKEMMKISAKDIQKLAKETFTNDKLNMAIIGPYKDPHQFDSIVTLKKG